MQKYSLIARLSKLFLTNIFFYARVLIALITIRLYIKVENTHQIVSAKKQVQIRPRICHSKLIGRDTLYIDVHTYGHGDVYALYIHIDVLACTITLLTLKTGRNFRTRRARYFYEPPIHINYRDN